MISQERKEVGQNWNRTSDTRIFSPLLYRLSYLAKPKASTIGEIDNLTQLNLYHNFILLYLQQFIRHLLIFFPESSPFQSKLASIQ